ncbi:MAG: hypothetical protein MUF58_18030 [Arcicella sp.]|nr:hypothetical protein [Arcicella sp.]
MIQKQCRSVKNSSKLSTNIFLGIFCLVILSVQIGCKSSKNLQTTSYYQPNYQTGGYEQRPGLGFQIPEKYPIEVLIGDEKPQTAVQEIEKLTISDETPIQPNQDYKGTMLKRGNDQQQKKALLDRMVAQAQDLGASGLMNINYKVFSTQKTSGYILTGTAFKYVLK